MLTILTDFFPIQTVRLFLRPLRQTDAAEAQQMTNDPAITDFLDFFPQPFTTTDAEQLIRGAGDGRDCFIGAWGWDGELAVIVGTHLQGQGEVEIGYWVRATSQGQGYATEAASGVVAALRQAFPQRRIVAECRAGNSASWHVLAKLGFSSMGKQGRRADRLQLVLRTL